MGRLKKLKKIRIHREGTHILWASFLLLLLINAALYWGIDCKIPFYVVAVASIVVYLLMVNFFRCPIRLFGQDTEKIVVAPADGKIVVIEEVDNEIHPSRADFLVKQIQNIVSRRGLRVFISSHNPALLDAVPDTALGDVLCCYRNPEDGSSRIVRLADMKRFPELVAQGSLGQLMTSNRLEKFLKDTTSEEKRKQAALSWLEQLSRETVV